jgi:dienelactone hydrolase
MMRRLVALVAVALGVGYVNAQDIINPKRFQPPITHTTYPDVVVSGWSFNNNVRRTGVAPMVPLVPAYDGPGKLIASWNPQPDVASRPTFVILHGGHGVSPGNFQSSQWLIQNLRANVLILDSYLARGRQENWRTWNEFGANMRSLDAIAAGRFVASQGSDPGTTFILGDSQGGWTTLRTFTKHDKEAEVKKLFAGGVAIYPNCYAKDSLFSSAPNGSNDPEFAPSLGPYFAPVLVFTGSEDTATPISQCNVDKALKGAERWIEFKGATHAWDAPNRGAGNKAVDGECSQAPNEFNRFRICRSDKFTEETFRELTAFVTKHGKPVGRTTVPAPTSSRVETDVDRRTRELLEEMQKK